MSGEKSAAMRSDDGAANVNTIIAAPLVLGAMIWLFVGIPYNMLWLFGLMLAAGMFFAWRARRVEDQANKQQGDEFLDNLQQR